MTVRRPAKRHEVAIEKRAAALQHGEEPAVDLRQRGLDRIGVGAARQRQRIPGHAIEPDRLPDALERRGVGGGEQLLQRVGEAAQALDDVHTLKLRAAARLARGDVVHTIWKTRWKSCGCATGTTLRFPLAQLNLAA